MADIEWDNLEDRTYERGVDRGVLYLPETPGDYKTALAVPWNGLVSVVEKSSFELMESYYEGVRSVAYSVPSPFSATVTAITYPEEFMAFEGLSEIYDGVYADEQPPKAFGMSYRTRVGDALGGEYYKLHMIYNAVAIPSDKTYATMSEDHSPQPFDWELTTIPEEMADISPTSHLVLDSRKVREDLLDLLEFGLYGKGMFSAKLPPISEIDQLIQMMIESETP